MGFPVGVKGIFQLVQGPQYATGVGLVRYGAQKLGEQAAHASEKAHASSGCRWKKSSGRRAASCGVG